MKLPLIARGERLDRAIQRELEAQGRVASAREVREALRDARILVDRGRRPPGERANGGEEITLDRFTPRSEARFEPDFSLARVAPVIFQDEHLLVLDKPSGMHSVPLVPGEQGTLLSAAIGHCIAVRDAGPPLEGGLVHRLDHGTSGVVVFAKDLATREQLRSEIGHGCVVKTYLALCHDPARCIASRRVIDAAIAPGSLPSRVKTVGSDAESGVQAALPARTEIRLSERISSDVAWVEAIARTGRRHQIRAHLASIGAPILGDGVYGTTESKALSIPRLCLHAASLELSDGRAFHSEIPAELRAIMAELQGHGP